MKDATLDLEDMQGAAADACRLMKVLSNPDRLLILCQLSQGKHRVGELEESLGIVQPTLSQQLTVLREEALVSTRRDGKNIHYLLDSPSALAAMQVLYAEFCGAPRKNHDHRLNPLHAVGFVVRWHSAGGGSAFYMLVVGGLAFGASWGLAGHARQSSAPRTSLTCAVPEARFQAWPRCWNKPPGKRPIEPSSSNSSRRACRWAVSRPVRACKASRLTGSKPMAITNGSDPSL